MTLELLQPFWFQNKNETSTKRRTDPTECQGSRDAEP